MTQPSQAHTGTTEDGRQVAYPICCNRVTRLSVLGWHCAVCGTYHDFKSLMVEASQHPSVEASSQKKEAP